MHGVLSPIWLPAATIIGVCQGDKKEQNNNKLMALPYHIGQRHTLCSTVSTTTVISAAKDSSRNGTRIYLILMCHFMTQNQILLSTNNSRSVPTWSELGTKSRVKVTYSTHPLLCDSGFCPSSMSNLDQI